MPGMKVNPPMIPAPCSVSVGFGLPAASMYAVIMSFTAVVSNVGFTSLPVGPNASTEYIVPVTSACVTPMAAPVIGEVPIFPVILDVGTSVIPDSDRITKLPAVPRTTGAGPAAFASGTGAKTPVNMDISKNSATSVARTLLIRSSPLGCAVGAYDGGSAVEPSPRELWHNRTLRQTSSRSAVENTLQQVWTPQQ